MDLLTSIIKSHSEKGENFKMEKCKKTVFKNLLALCMAICVTLSLKCNVKATELPCNINVSVIDTTEGCKATVNITLSTISGVQQYFITSDLFGTVQTFPCSDKGKANVAITTDTAGWKVVDKDSLKEITTIELVAGGSVDLNLAILPTSDNAEYADMGKAIEQGEKIVTDMLNHISPSEDNGNAQTVSSTNSGIGENTDGASEVYQNFLTKTEILKNDSSWDNLLNTNYGIINRTSMKAVYLANVNGATEEKWNDMSNYDIFVYTETYLRFANMVGSEANPFNEYFSKGDTGIEKYMTDYVAQRNFTGTNASEVIEAIRELAKWQVAFIQEHNYPYNFVTGKSYAEETKIETDSTQGTEEYVSKEDVKEAQEALKDDVKTQSKSLWQTVFDKISKHWFSIVLVVVFAVAYFVVHYIRKKKAVDDMTTDGKN